MRTIIILFLSLCIISCDKEECIAEIQEELSNRMFYNEFFCDPGESYKRIYYSEQEYKQDTTCQTWGTMPIDIGFDGIIVGIGVRVPYGGENAYDKSVIIQENICDKSISVDFKLKSIDTTSLFENTDNVLIFLNGYDDSYEVNLSHEIIPLGG